MTLTIRRAVATDAEAMASLLSQLGYATHPGAMPARLDAVHADGGIALVAVVDDTRIVGAACGAKHAPIHADHPTAYITALVTDESYRRHGVGRQLVGALEQWAREQGCRRMSVTSAERRSDAHTFYELCGFPYTGRRFTKALEDVES